MKKQAPIKDGLGVELDDDALYYLQDTRQKVGNCMLFWGVKDRGYTCQLDDAGKYTGSEARDRCRDGDHKAWPCGFIERNAVRHVRADSIDVRLAAIDRARKGGDHDPPVAPAKLPPLPAIETVGPMRNRGAR